MSTAIPTPVSRSRLPKPPSTSSSSSSGIGLAGSKRSRRSTDLEEGTAKKTKMGSEMMGPPRGNLSKAKSMMNLNKPVGGGRMTTTKHAVPNLARPLPSSMTTGRSTSAVSSNIRSSSTSSSAASVNSRRPLGPANTLRAAMNDRTNVVSASSAEGQKGKGGKRAPWDLKGRLEDMESMFASTTERVATLECQNTVLKTNVEQKEKEKETVVALSSQELTSVKTENASLAKQVESLKKELAEITESSGETIRKLKREVEDLEFSKSGLDRRLKSLEDELSSKQEEVAGLRSSVAQMTSSQAGIEADLKQTKKKLATCQGQVADLTKIKSEQAARIDIFEENERAFETERRKLHNTIQELKGNIRVFCRIRPLLRDEDHEGSGSIKHIDVVDKKCMALVRTADSPNESVAGGLKGKSGKYDFEFDRVFNATASQTEVFGEIEQLVQSAMDGYNVCIFAYGQTGSGKTFTMEGGEEEGQEGMIPLTIQKIFEGTKRLADKGWEYNMKASFLEIYNEDIRDLLATEKNLKYEIRLGKDGTEYVTNLHVEEVTTPHQIAQLLRRARKNRAVAATNCNERSSRSHSVFQMKISGNNILTSESCCGMLNLVDLAGSERLKESGSEGVRLTETKSINKSLANLGNVIMALAQKDQHIPYRNSKLTHVLQGSLGGNSKTLMFVNVSPREEYFGETLNSLRFATKVNQCQIGTAQKVVR